MRVLSILLAIGLLTPLAASTLVVGARGAWPLAGEAADLPLLDPARSKEWAEQAQRIDGLFAELASAPDAASAAELDARIWDHWSSSGSATIDILIERGLRSQAQGDFVAARRFFDDAIHLHPAYAEAWNRRATLAFAQDDMQGALADITETLKREPRHYSALAGMGLIFEELGQPGAAMEAYRAALAMHPFLDEARQGLARLQPSAQGRDL